MGGDEGAVQLEIIEMQHNMALHNKHKDTPSIEYGNVKNVLTMLETPTSVNLDILL